jgi:hypothetical protein
MRRLAITTGIVLVVTLAARLLASANGGGSITLPGAPSFTVTRLAGNPLITVNATETLEQYEPAPFRATNGDIWVYVKGQSRIYAYKSTDDGETFTIQNGGSAVLTPTASAWDSSFVLEPTVLYDEANGTIHMWYKGRNPGADNWQWGHATADDSDPTSWTKDAANPIFTEANIDSDLGANVVDFAISSVIKIGSTFHFYGYAELATGYGLVQATGTTWNDPSNAEMILQPGDPETVFRPSVFKDPGSGLYVMLYSHGTGLVDPGETGNLRMATSVNGEDWTFPGTVFMDRQGTGWEELWAYGANMMRVNVDPWAEPYTDGSGRWLLYYSGLSDDFIAQSGLAYVE